MGLSTMGEDRKGTVGPEWGSQGGGCGSGAGQVSESLTRGGVSEW